MKSRLREFRITFEPHIYILIALYILFAYFSLIQLLALGFLALLEENEEPEKIKSIADHRKEDNQGGKVGNNSVRDSWGKNTNFYWCR